MTAGPPAMAPVQLGGTGYEPQLLLQQIVYELSVTLAAPRIVPKRLFRRAQELLGDAGIADLTVLMGWFTAVSLTLMAYDVPSNATGLDQ
jgi:4-carboxymuconolactone decarboxylase